MAEQTYEKTSEKKISEKNQNSNILKFSPLSSSSTNKNTQSQVFPTDANLAGIGIDLGTSHSVVSLFEAHDERPKTLEYEGNVLVPSVVYFDGNEVYVGHKAIDLARNHPTELIQSTKRSMGQMKSSSTHEQSFESNGRTFSAQDVASEILRYLVDHPTLLREREKSGKIWAVITVPAHFDDAARMATLQAAKQVGLNVLRIVNEPTAAALAYSLFEDVKDEEKELLAVYDLGGGTFDVSIVDRNGLTFTVLSSEGEVSLGGDDFDKCLADHFKNSMEPEFAKRQATPASPLYREILSLAKKTKCALTFESLVDVDVSRIAGWDATLKLKVTRAYFESLIHPLVDVTLKLTQKALKASRRPFSSLSRILCVGGSTRVPYISQMLMEYFGTELVDSRLEPDLAVSWGAALQAALILGIKPDTILVDVCSHSLGIGVATDSKTVNDDFLEVAKHFGVNPKSSEYELRLKLGDRVEEFFRELQNRLQMVKIIHRNTCLPAKKSEFFSTMYANQKSIQIVLVQGEQATVGENKLIGDFLFDLVQPAPVGTKCEVQLTYDVNGMIQVRAKQAETNNFAEAQFDSRTGKVLGWKSMTESKVSEQPATFVTVIENLKEQNLVEAPPPTRPPSTFGNVTNLLLDRAKRHCNKLNKSGVNTSEFSNLIETYITLLNGANLPEETDAVDLQFDETEAQLKVWLSRPVP